MLIMCFNLRILFSLFDYQVLKNAKFLKLMEFRVKFKINTAAEELELTL